MLFNSYIFIFLFLPISLIGYYLLNYFKRYKLAEFFLIGMSLWFYGYFNKSYLFIIIGSVIFNYVVSRYVDKTMRENKKKLILISGICANVAVIFYFKYYNFFLESMGVVFKKNFELQNIVLPLGISFFTFQQISYLVDSYMGETRKYTFSEYMMFVTFFPQLIAGPIVLHDEVIPQFRNQQKRRIIPQNFSRGLHILAIGLFKKVIIADTFSKAVEYGFGDVWALSSMETLIVSVSYTFQLYFDFSGYCDMALGIGSMFNIELPINFDSPYKSTSITEFWSRWHMSLTRFLKRYIYIPIGGNRKGKFRTYINIMIVYLISGLWHGANWTFILWGGVHGLLNCLNRLFRKQWEILGKVTQWFITFSVVNILWIVFRADTVDSAVLFIKKMCCLSDFTIRDELYDCFKMEEFAVLEEYSFVNYFSTRITGIYLWIFVFGAFFVVLNCRNSQEKKFNPTLANSVITAFLLVWSVVSFAGVSTFLYFDF